MLRASRIFGVIMVIVGVLFVLGSVEPEQTAPMWQVVGFALVGFSLIHHGYRIYMEARPRRIFLRD